MDPENATAHRNRGAAKAAVGLDADADEDFAAARKLDG